MPEILLKPPDLSAHSTRLLLQWCLERGSDQFTWGCLGGASGLAPFCVAVEQALESLALPAAPRPHLTRTQTEPFIRETGLWRFNNESLVILTGFLPDGLFTDRQGNSDGWIEDVTLYRGSELLLGVITHEGEAALRATDAEIRDLRERRLVPRNSVNRS